MLERHPEDPGEQASEQQRQRYELETALWEQRPMRGRSAYIYYSRERAERLELLKREQHQMSFGEVSKALGVSWADMSVEEKQPYVEKGKLDQQRYEDEMQEWHRACVRTLAPWGHWSAAVHSEFPEETRSSIRCWLLCAKRLALDRNLALLIAPYIATR